jgi:hypothetical protein
LVVTGDADRLIRMIMADSGEILGQWQAFRNILNDVSIAVKAGTVMGAFGSVGLSIWSVGVHRLDDRSSSPASADALPLSRVTDGEALSNISKHSWEIRSIAFSGDGEVAASCAYNNKFVLVCNTAKGTVLRKLEFNEAGRILPRAVAVSRSGDWIMCGGEIGEVRLWGGPSNQELFAHVSTTSRPCCVAFNSSSQDRLHGAIRCDIEDDEYEAYQWAHSGSSLDPKIILTPTAAYEGVVPELKQARQGSRELLLEIIDGGTELHVRDAALDDGVARCICKAAAVFD